MEQKKEAPFEIYVCNYEEAAPEGGGWIALPQQKEQLDDFLQQHGGEEKLMILDASIREDCAFMEKFIDEWTNIRQLNAAAGLIGDVPHPAAEAYLKASGSLTLEELANLLLQEEQITDAEGLEEYSREQIRGQGPDLSFYRMEEIIKSHEKAEWALPENRREPAETV